jgi:DNA-binding protein HU-beta
MDHVDMIRKLAASTAHTERELRELFIVFAEVVRGAFLEGQDVHLNGIGKLENKLCKPRKGRNPITGKPVDIPSRRRIRFHPCRQLEKRLRKIGNPLQEDSGKFLKRTREHHG